MGARIVSILGILILMSGCALTPKDESSLSTDNDMMMMDMAPTALDTNIDTSVDMAMQGGAVPGTQQDLVMNVGDRVFFGYDKYNLTGEGRTLIEKQAMWLKQYPHLNVNVEGHCDERGTREYNLALGEKRAMAVRNYLIALGVDANRIQTISYGKERPAVTGSDETSWAQNRRGVIILQ